MNAVTSAFHYPKICHREVQPVILGCQGLGRGGMKQARLGIPRAGLQPRSPDLLGLCWGLDTLLALQARSSREKFNLTLSA